MRLVKVIPFLGIALLVLMSSVVQAQNTKGDKAQGEKKTIFRLPKLKGKSKGGDKAYTNDVSGRRKIRTKNKSSAARAASSDRSRPPYVNKRPSNDKEYIPQ